MVDFFHCNWDQIFNLVCLNIQSLLKSVIVVIKIYEIELKMAIARGHPTVLGGRLKVAVAKGKKEEK